MIDYNLEQPHALPHVPTETVYLCPAQSELVPAGINGWLGATDAQIIVIEIDEAASAMAGCYEHLPASAKASAIKLGHALSSLRRRMVAPNESSSATTPGKP